MGWVGGEKGVGFVVVVARRAGVAVGVASLLSRLELLSRSRAIQWWLEEERVRRQ